MRRYVHQRAEWPQFTWDSDAILEPLAALRASQGKLLGRMAAMGFELQDEALLGTLTIDVTKTSEIEGEFLDPTQVRSSLARKLGLDAGGLVHEDRNVDGVVELMLNATRNPEAPLTADRLFGWHALLFQYERSGKSHLTVGGWRGEEGGPMQVVSGPYGRMKVHFEAPDANRLPGEMAAFLDWFNAPDTTDPVLKAAIAHFWFVTIHPFDDGNGRIARAITDMQLCRADGVDQRFYSMSSQILQERNAYYDILELCQAGTPDITLWLQWFLGCLGRALKAAETMLSWTTWKAHFWQLPETHGINERQRKVLNMLMGTFNSKLRTGKWSTIAKCSEDTALRDLTDLVQRKVLERQESGGRSTYYWWHPRLHPVPFPAPPEQ